MRLKTETITIILVISWLLLMIWCFWWFYLRWQNSMDAFLRDELFSTTALVIKDKNTNVTTTLYHFYDQSCPCTKFNTEHVQNVIDKYDNQGVNFIVVVPNTESLFNAQVVFPRADHVVSRPDFKPPASPSALIISTNSTAEYIGPWSPTAVCSSHKEDYVSQVLDELLQGNHFNQSHNLARGCLCPWPERISI